VLAVLAGQDDFVVGARCEKTVSSFGGGWVRVAKGFHLTTTHWSLVDQVDLKS
jgi:hypothetical protein